jgi:hypothetical protein
MSDIMAEPYDENAAEKDKKYDPEAQKCKGYNRGQNESCMCVPKAEFKGLTEKKLKSFYGKFNPEKLDSKGDIKDVDDVWKKWKGKEADMFMALNTKYKAKAVEIRVKPTPPPYKPRDKDATSSGDSEEPAEAAAAEGAPEGAAEGSSEEVPAKGGLDEEDRAYEAAQSALEAKKQQAKEEEEFDLAEQARDEAKELTQKEVERLKAKKAKAIEEEDFIEAKRIKQRLTEL